MRWKKQQSWDFKPSEGGPGVVYGFTLRLPKNNLLRMQAFTDVVARFKDLILRDLLRRSKPHDIIRITIEHLRPENSNGR